MRNRHADVVATLLGQVARVTKASNDDDTPLSFACERRERAERLLAANADVNQSAYALLIASQNGHADFANVDVRTSPRLRDR